MLEQGANINKSDSYGRSPLHLAAAVDYGEMVQFLIENGGEDTVVRTLYKMLYRQKFITLSYKTKFIRQKF